MVPYLHSVEYYTHNCCRRRGTLCHTGDQWRKNRIESMAIKLIAKGNTHQYLWFFYSINLAPAFHGFFGVFDPPTSAAADRTWLTARRPNSATPSRRRVVTNFYQQLSHYYIVVLNSVQVERTHRSIWPAMANQLNQPETHGSDRIIGWNAFGRGVDGNRSMLYFVPIHGDFRWMTLVVSDPIPSSATVSLPIPNDHNKRQ